MKDQFWFLSRIGHEIYYKAEKKGELHRTTIKNPTDADVWYRAQSFGYVFAEKGF